MAISAANQAEIKRKASLGIKLTNPTKETSTVYNSLKIAPKTVVKTTPTTVSTTTKTNSIVNPNLKTAADYAAELARDQVAYKQYDAAGRDDLQQGAASFADKVRAQAKAAGVDLSGFGTKNAYGTDYTSLYTGNSAGVYDPSQAGRAIKPMQDATPVSGVQPVSQPVVSQPVAQPTPNDLTGFKDSQTNLINQIYENQKAALLQKTRDQRDTQLQGLNKVNTQADESATAQRSQVAAADIQAGQRLSEAMAQMGLKNSGDNLTAIGDQSTQRQASMGQVNQNLAQVKQDVEERKKLINDAAASNDLALLQQLQAQQSTDLQQLGYQMDDRGFRNNQFDWQKQTDTAGLTGYLNNERTLPGQQFDANQAQQGWNNRFDFGRATGTFADGQHSLDYTQMMSGLTGKLPNGQATTGEQQRQLGNMWTVAQQTGTIPNQLADMYGIPRGTKTQDAIQQASNMSLGWDASNRGWDDSSRQWSQLDYNMQYPSSANGGGYNGMTPGQLLDSIKTIYTEPILSAPDTLGGQTKLGTQLTTDPVKREQMFLDVVDSHLESDAATRQVLHGLGFTKTQIDDLMKKYGSSPGK